MSTTSTVTSTVVSSGGINNGFVWTWVSVLNTTTKTVELTLNQPAAATSSGGFAWNFVLNFNTTLFPSGGGITPTFRSGSYLTPNNTSLGVQYNPLILTNPTQTSITVSSGGTSNFLSGNYNIVSYIIIQYD
jgi:hypothetical protein